MPKALHIAIISVLLVAIIFTALMLILKYDEKGEENMPFEITKFSIISTVDAQDIENSNYKWSKQLGLNNDIYIYLDKNKEYKKTETIDSVIINNLKIISKAEKGEFNVYKPSTKENVIFENSDENKTQELIFKGAQKTNLQKLELSNQGGIIAFRFANQKLGNVVSNEDTLEYKNLLKKLNIKESELKAKVSFDITLILDGGKQFKAKDIELELPADDTTEKGESSKEIESPNLVFKRIEN